MTGELPVGEVTWTCYEQGVWVEATVHVALTEMEDHIPSQEKWLRLEGEGASLPRLLGIKK